MKIRIGTATQAFFCALLLINCNGESPTAPMLASERIPVASDTGTIVGLVQSSSGACLEGAIVEVLDGPRAGAKAAMDCSDFDGGAYLSNMPANINVRLRASQPGYRSQEQTVISPSFPTPHSGMSVVFKLPRE